MNAHHRFSLTAQASPHLLEVLAFSGDEAISTPFSYDVEVVCERPDLDLEALLHTTAFLAFDTQGHGIHGQIYHMVRCRSGPRLTHYRLSLRPQLAYLLHRTNHRIFQNQTVQCIIETLLEEHGIFSNVYGFALQSAYTPREYCVQYGESDLHFIQRLCFEEGIHYLFFLTVMPGVFVSQPSKVSLRLRYRTPLTSLLGALSYVGGERGVAFTVSSSSGVVELRDDPTPELDRAPNYVLGNQACSVFLQPGLKK